MAQMMVVFILGGWVLLSDISGLLDMFFFLDLVGGYMVGAFCDDLSSCTIVICVLKINR